MLESKYSAPDLPLYDDASAPEEDLPWAAPVADAPISATLQLPGSKSLTNRELILSALADGTSVLRSPLHSRDSEAMVQALRSFGVQVEERQGTGEFGPDLVITPPDELLGSTTVDCDQAGTVMRFAPPLATLALGPTAFDADPTARTRPMSALINGLRSLGADIADDGSGTLPFTVHGTGSLRGGSVTIDASKTSQFVSALLLAGARFDEGVHLRHSGERLPSIPHIEMTVDALAERGVSVESPETGVWIVAPQRISARDMTIEPDLSNAAPFLAAAVATGGTVSIRDWPTTTTQVGAQLTELLPHFGATVHLSDGVLSVTGPETITPVTLDLGEAGELAPPLIALAALATGTSTFTGIGHIRHHETDRLAALVTEINRLGGDAKETEDGIIVTPRPLHGDEWQSYHDHRMATAGAIIGLRVPGVSIENIKTTSKTLPQFTQLWQRMLGA
ncbi:MAG: 3-phosphoshikimate 1-carboxyvinyltransferase [Mycetocola sp.]